MPNTILVPTPNTGEAVLTKKYHPLDIRSTISNPSSQYQTTILSSVPRNTPIPDATNTPVDPTESFKTIIYDITKVLTFLIAHISYEPQIILFQLGDIN